MALRKFVYIDQTEGFSTEQGATDELSLGKITLAGVAGVALDGGGARADNFADPNSATGLATKQYVDSVASGLDVKASVRLATAAALPACTAAGSGVGKTLTANANGALTVDNVAVANGNRILVKDQATAADNGIYVVTDLGSGGTPFILTRATDADQNAEVTAGLFTFVAEGTANADTGWVLTTNDAIVVDTTGLAFSQFSSTTAFTFDQGLLKTGASITVELDTGANAQGAGAGGGSSGLEFDANNAAGKLRAAVHATGGLERTGTGLAAKLNGTTLLSAAGGLSVKGLPSLFEINAVAVSANVTAPNLDTLTGGGDASALHTHANGEAARVENTIVADEALAAGDPVAFSVSVNDRVVKGLANSDAKSRIVGVARTAAVAQGNSSEVVTAGIAAGVLSGATVGTPYYLAAAGGLTTTLPGSGNRLVQCGIAKNATDLFVRVVDYGKKA